jgi:hypothetical protein
MKRPMKSNTKPFIAKDTKEPLVVLGYYRVSEDGGIIGDPILPRKGDIGCDPLPDGKFRMVPSGDIVDIDERNKRLENQKKGGR